MQNYAGPYWQNSIYEEKTLGQVLRSRRASIKATQRVLAQRLNVKPSHVAYLETDQRPSDCPALALAERLERLIGSIRRESLDHLIVFYEAQLRRVLKNYASL
jgi:transcriptional regulator with XRE-family HTH domain